MKNAKTLRGKMGREEIPLGTGVSFTDPVVTELFSHTLDFVFINM